LEVYGSKGHFIIWYVFRQFTSGTSAY
jgi:hypothetical protein